MKRILALVLTLALVFSLADCHGSRAEEGVTVERKTYQVPDEFIESRNYQITFWAKNDTNLTQVAIYKQAIADFEALYPNITVNLRLYTDYGRIYNDVITNIATATPTTACTTYPDPIAPTLPGVDTVPPSDALAQDPRYGLGGSAVRFDSPTMEQVIPQFLEECYQAGTLYALPFMRSTECCYVNKTFVEKLGYTLPEILTWDYVWEVSEAAMKQDADGNYLINGQKVLIPFIYKSTDNMMIQMLRQKGAGYSTASRQIEIFNETTRSLLTTIGAHSASKSFNTFKLIGYPANFLNAGQCIFAVDSTAGATWMGSEAPLIDIAEDKLVPFETVVLPVPQFDPEQPQMISQGPSLCVFQKDDPQEVLASWLFAQYLLTNSVQIAYSCTEGYVPVTSKAQESREDQDYLNRRGEDNQEHYSVKIDAAKLLMDNTANTFVTPVFNGSTSLRNAAGQLIENVNLAVRQGKTLDDKFITKQFNDVASLYRLNQIRVQEGTDPTGPLPTASILLLGGLGLTWAGMGIYCLKEYRKNARLKRK